MNSIDDLEETARLVKLYRVKLAYSHNNTARLAFKDPTLPASIRVAIRNRRRGLARLMAAGDIRVCPAPDLHRHAWFYAGRGRFACSLCQRLDAAQLGLWQKVS